PVILSLNPSSAVVGTGSFLLQVTGANFTAGAQGRWNGSSRTTDFTDSAHVVGHILRAAILSPRSVQVTGVTPTGRRSSAVTFQILPNSPSITSINPNSVQSGSAGFTLQVIGQNFASTAVVNVNNSARNTTYVDGSHLNAEIPATDVSFQRTLNITVTNPSN